SAIVLPSPMVWAASAITALIAASATALSTAPPGHRARAAISQGHAHIARGQIEAALRDADRAEGQGASAPPELRSAAEEIRGAVAEARSELEAETAHYLRSLEWADRSGDQELIGRAVDSVFHAYFTQ